MLFRFIVLSLSIDYLISQETETKCDSSVQITGESSGPFTPSCDEEGNFGPIQCSGSTGYCWCSPFPFSYDPLLPELTFRPWLLPNSVLNLSQTCDLVKNSECVQDSTNIKKSPFATGFQVRKVVRSLPSCKELFEELLVRYDVNYLILDFRKGPNRSR